MGPHRVVAVVVDPLLVLLGLPVMGGSRAAGASKGLVGQLLELQRAVDVVQLGLNDLPALDEPVRFRLWHTPHIANGSGAFAIYLVMKLVRTPPDTQRSGQAVVAMLLGTTLDDAIDLMGTVRFVSTQAIIDKLRERGVKVGDRRIPARGKPFPESCIVFARAHHGSAGRWLLRWDGRKYDPAIDWHEGDDVLTSYIPLG